uniref:Protein kinase domain-containing protein n=1 Tax=Romanomermis culicivorax TaxID=13658 RepID=A0A915IP89_ROMCU
MPINVDSVSIISTRSIIFDDRTFAIDLIYVYSFITDDRKNQSQFLRNRLLIGEHFDVKNSTILSRVEDLSSNLPTNVFSFIYADYAYFLRVKNGKLRYENKRSIFLERICLNDVKNSEFRSFISSFLFETRNCSDKSIIANYDYQTKTLQIFFNGGKEFHYSLIEYTLANVHARINDMFYDCYNSSNAFDIAILTPSPKMCRIYRMYEDRYKPCGVDLCSPTSCALTGRFHIESYRKISFDRRFSLISSTPINRQTSCDEVLLSVNPPRIFHSSVINADVDDSAISFINDTLIVGSKNKIEYIALNCSFIDSCPDSMSLRNLSLFANCGWCYNSFGKSFSSSREQCLLDDKNVFLNDVCPPETDCFENDYINVNSSTEIHFRGFFPNVISMNATVCGIPCQLISSNESRLSCHIESHNPNEINPANLHCSIELEVMFRNKIFKANPKCSKKLLVQRLPIIEQVMQNDEILRKKNNNLVVFLTISTLLLIFAFACIAYRRISIRKKANDSNSHWYNTLPLRPFEFISHRMNSYVAEPGADTYCSIERSEGIYDDLSYLVPDNVRIPWNSITKEEMIGMGHFGEVYRGIYTKPNGRVFTVAIKTLRIN